MVDFVSFIGLIAGIFLVVLGYVMDGGILSLLWLPSAIVITLGGALGSVIMSYSFYDIIKFPKLFLKVFISPKSSINKTIEYLLSLSDKARRDGLLSLEKVIAESSGKDAPDNFLKKAILMAIDGTDPDEIRDILENEIDIYEQKELSAISMFDSFAAYSPAFGMIGTIVGLIMLLQDMSSPEKLTKGIAVAFITTLYGVVLANSIFTPCSRKLKNQLSEYRLEKEMIIEGVCAIRNSVNPRLLKDKLSIYSTPGKIKKTAVKKPL